MVRRIIRKAMKLIIAAIIGVLVANFNIIAGIITFLVINNIHFEKHFRKHNETEIDYKNVN